MVIGVPNESADESDLGIFAHVLGAVVHKSRGGCFRVVLPRGVARVGVRWGMSVKNTSLKYRLLIECI
jgi:hypothetical protein